MGASLRISKILDYQYEDEIRFKRITTIYNWEVIEELLDLGRRNWCLEGDCGAIFELSGEELNDIKEMLEFEDNNLIKYQFDDLEYYECRLSY